MFFDKGVGAFPWCFQRSPKIIVNNHKKPPLNFFYIIEYGLVVDNSRNYDYNFIKVIKAVILWKRKIPIENTLQDWKN